MKEPFYCRLQTVVLSQARVAHAVICEGCRGLVLIRAVKRQGPARPPVSIEAEFTEWCTRWEGDYGQGPTTHRDASAKERMLKHFDFARPVVSSTFSPCPLKTAVSCLWLSNSLHIWSRCRMKLTLCPSKWESCSNTQPQCWLSGARDYDSLSDGNFYSWG